MFFMFFYLQINVLTSMEQDEWWMVIVISSLS